MNLQPCLDNDLIKLRPLLKSDFDQLFLVAQDPLIWEQHPNRDRYNKNVFTDFFEDSIKSKGALVVIEKSSNQIIGSSRFKRIDNVANAIEIGWTFLSREYWGGKFNKSMKKLMIEYAFETFDNIIFYVGKENIRSQKAVLKIGAKRILGNENELLKHKNENNWTFKINIKDWVNLLT